MYVKKNNKKMKVKVEVVSFDRRRVGVGKS